MAEYCVAKNFMNQNCLVLYLEPSWPQQPRARWVLLNSAEAVLEHGESDPSHWPITQRYEVVLAGAQTHCLRLKLPRASRRERAQLLHFALEDQLLSDPETQHCCIRYQRSEQTGVVVVSKERLRLVLAQLTALKRIPSRISSELETVPTLAPDWSLVHSSHHTLLRCGAEESTVVDHPMVAVALSLAARHGAPKTLHCFSLPGVPLDPSLQAWAEPLGCVIQTQPYAWWQERWQAANLLQGAFASHQGRDRWRPLRPAAWLLATTLAIHGVLLLGEWLSLRYQVAEQQQQMVRILQQTLPNVPAIAPAAQLKQQLNLARSQHGLLRDDDVLALLAGLTQALGQDAANGVQGLSYQNQKLDVRLSAAVRARAAGVLARLKHQGIHGEIVPGEGFQLRLYPEL
jgi:general secretion pathway protein L